MRKLVLVRHSLPLIDPAVDSREWRLSVEGRRRCARLADILREHDPALVVTSTEPKALETGAIVARRLRIPLESTENLHEHDRRGAPFVTSEGSFVELVADLFRRPGELVFGNETADQAYERYAAAVDGLLARYSEGNLVVVSHGTVMTLFVARRAGADPIPFWRALRLPALAVLALPGYELLQVVNRVGS